MQPGHGDTGRAEGPSAVRPAGTPAFGLQHTRALGHLGRPLEVYAPDPTAGRRNARQLWFGLTFFLLLELLLLALPLLPTRPGRRPSTTSELLVFHAFCGFFIAACGWRLRQLVLGRRVQVTVFADGMAVSDGRGLTPYRWDEVEAVEGAVTTYRAGGAAVGARFRITVRSRDGRRLRIDTAKSPLAGAGALFETIVGQSARHLLPRSVAAIEAGEVVTFGPFGVGKSGLHWGTGFVAWADPGSVDLGTGLQVRNPNAWPLHPWTRLADWPVPNQHVFLSLAERYAREARRDPTAPECDQESSSS